MVAPNAPQCYVICTLPVVFVPVTVNSNRYVTHMVTQGLRDYEEELDFSAKSNIH